MVSPYTTAVPPPSWNTATGFISASPAAILAGVQADINSAFNKDFNFSANTPQGQIATTETAIISDVQDTFCFYTQMMDPAYSQGRMHDAIARIYFLERNSAEPSVTQVICAGNGATIPVGALIIDPDDNLWQCTQQGTISGLGSITLPFACKVPGPVAIPLSFTIVTVIGGWDSAAPSSGEVGNDTETDAAFEQRRQDSIEGNSFGAIGSIIGAVSEVPGVLDYWGYDNGTSSPVTVLGVTIPANSVFISVSQGSATNLQVATAIFSKKAPGCGTYGNTSVTVTDTNPLFSNPPSYTINYNINPFLQILFNVILVQSNSLPSNAGALVAGAITSLFNGQVPNYPRARIASLILAATYSAVITALGSWAQIREVKIGSINGADAEGTACSISGNQLTTGGTITGAFAIGQTIIDANGLVPAGVTIASGTGSPWTLSATLGTIASETMWGVVADEDYIQVNGNQTPALSQANIVVTAT